MMADALLLAAAISACVVYLVMAIIARRRERELALARAHEERLKSLTELSADWFWETDAGHRITWLSGGGPVATLFGDTPTFGKRFWEIPRVEVDARALEAHLERLGKQLPFFDLEIARTDERGARQVHIISGQSHHGPDGRFSGYRGVGRDVTEQRHAERRLQQAKARIELALDGGNMAEWHYVAAGDELYAGDGWVRFLGHDKSPSTTRGEQFFGTIHPDDRAVAREAWVRALKARRPSTRPTFAPPSGMAAGNGCMPRAASPSAMTPAGRCACRASSPTSMRGSRRSRRWSRRSSASATSPRSRANTCGRPTPSGATPTSRSASRR